MIRREKHVLNDTRVQLVVVSGVVLMRKNRNSLAISISVGRGCQSKRSGTKNFTMTCNFGKHEPEFFQGEARGMPDS